MPEAEFGFECGDFSVVLSGNNIILPGSKNAPLRKSLLPTLGLQESAGPYTLRAMHSGETVCDVPVQVLWVGQQSQPEPFLGLRSENTAELLATLKAYKGKAVSLTFKRRTL